MNRWILGVAVLGLAAIACTHHLAQSDLAAAPVWYEADTTTILATLGPPSHRVREEHGGSLGWLEKWYYPHLALTFLNGPWCVQIRLVDSAFATSRGSRVGDSLERVLRTYGRPASRRSYQDTVYVSYDGPRPWQELLFISARDTVRTIVIGQRAFVFM